MIFGIPIWIIVGVGVLAFIIIGVTVKATAPTRKIERPRNDPHSIWLNAPHITRRGRHRKPPEVK